MPGEDHIHHCAVLLGYPAVYSPGSLLGTSEKMKKDSSGTSPESEEKRRKVSFLPKNRPVLEDEKVKFYTFLQKEEKRRKVRFYTLTETAERRL